MSTLRDLIRDKGMSQRDLAQRIEVSEPALSKIVNGRQEMTAKVVRAMAGALGVTADEVLARTAPAPATEAAA